MEGYALQPFRVISRVLRIGTQCAKGYDLAWPTSPTPPPVC